MATIIIKNSTGSGAVPSSLTQGELAINVVDGKLFYGSGSGNIVKEFTGSGGGGGSTPPGGLTTQIQYNNAGVFGGVPVLTYDGTTLRVTGSFSGSLIGTSSWATNALTASYASNGGVTQLLAGPNITLSPTNGLGQVTVSSTAGGGGFNTATGSYGSFYDTTTQTNPVANVPRSMSFNSTDITNGVSISGSTSPFNTYIKTTNAGIYNIQFSAQVDKTDGGTDDIVIWLRKNGIDLTDTATTLTLPTNNSKVVAAWNWFVTSAAGDYYQIIWISADTDLRLLAEPITGTHPGIPSVILTANRVDQFLSNTGSFSGSFTGVFTGSLFGTASWANNATSASYVLNAISSSFATTASFAATASWANNALTASYVNTITQTKPGTFYLTFVDSNNSPEAPEQVFTNANITAVPSSGSISAVSIVSTQNLRATGSAIVSGSLVVTGSLQVGVPGVNLPAIDSTVGTLGRGTQTKIDWINAWLVNSSGLTVVDWESALLNDASGNSSVDATSRLLYDTALANSIDWESRFLYDATGVRAIAYDSRNLIYPNGTTYAINYGTQNQISMTGSVSVTGSFVVSGSSTFRNIGPAEFTGSVSSLNGFTGSLQGTASYATNAASVNTLKNIIGTTDGTLLSATTSNTLVRSVLIPANTVAVGDLVFIRVRARKSGTVGSLIQRLYINTSAAIGGSLVGTSTTMANTGLYQQIYRTLVVKSATVTETMQAGGAALTDDVVLTGAVANNNINWEVDQYLVVAHQNGSASDGSLNSFYHIQINKA